MEFWNRKPLQLAYNYYQTKKKENRLAYGGEKAVEQISFNLFNIRYQREFFSHCECMHGMLFDC